MGCNALIAGGTGEVGKRVTQLFTSDPRVNQVTSLVRRPHPNPSQPKLNYLQVDFDTLQTLPNEISPDIFVCCLGTTIKIAGTPEAFIKVDHEYVVTSAKAAIKNGAKTCIMISSVGANPTSNNLYLRTKGITEKDIENLTGFECIHILRPSLLRGPRAEFRLGEQLGALASLAINPLLVGPLAKYKSIHMNTVAKAIASLALNPASRNRVTVHQGNDLITLSNQHDSGNHLNSI